MKWLFVQPKSFHCWEALGIGYLISTLKRAGETDIEFKSGFFDHDRDIIGAANKADYVGFGCTSPQFHHAVSLANQIKSHKIIGGVHPSALPEDCLEHFDQVIVGEGENGITEILRGNKKPIIRTMPVGNLDKIPLPDRKTIKQYRNVAQAKRETGERIGSLFASRGCPFKCKFCASNALWGRKVRYRSARNIYSEFKKITKELKLDFVKFSDDTFTINKPLVTEFCELKLKNEDKTSWGANVHASTVSRPLLGLMKRAGCREAWIGVESGSEAILRDVGKTITVKQTMRVFKWCQEVGIKTRAYVLLGSPLETKETIIQTQGLIDKINPDHVGFTLLAPYPGTEYYDHEKHSGLDFSKIDEYGNDVTESKELDNATLKSEQKRLVDRYKAKAVPRQKKKEIPCYGVGRKPWPRIYLPFNL